jgi:glycosyltransferase involved in cell wall biosynthesis
MIIDFFETLRDNCHASEQLIICPKDSEIFKVATQKNIEVVGLDFKSAYSRRLCKNFSNEVDQFAPDILFLHNSKAHTIAVLSSVFFKLNVPMVLFRTLIKNVGTNFFRKFKYNHKSIKKIVCVSEPVSDILKLSIKDHSKLAIVGSVVDTDKFVNNSKNGFLHKEFNIPSDYKIIGNVSAFCKVKDHFTWVDTVEELFTRGLKAKYILIGEGSLQDQIKEYAISKGLENEIIFAGFRKDVEKCIPEFDLFLFTSKNEATGGVILESYACRVPVVAAKAGGIPTVLEHNETGLLAEVGNPIDFADKVEALFGNSMLRDKFVEKGFEFVMSTSTRAIICRQIYDVANDVVSNSNLKMEI